MQAYIKTKNFTQTSAIQFFSPNASPKVIDQTSPLNIIIQFSLLKQNNWCTRAPQMCIFHKNGYFTSFRIVIGSNRVNFPLTAITPESGSQYREASISLHPRFSKCWTSMNLHELWRWSTRWYCWLSHIVGLVLRFIKKRLMMEND